MFYTGRRKRGCSRADRWLASGYWVSRSGRQDVLVDPKEVFRIVLRFHRRETFVIIAVGRLDTPLDLVVAHEIDVSSFEVERVNRRPVGAPPRLQGIGLLRVGVDPSDDHG